MKRIFLLATAAAMMLAACTEVEHSGKAEVQEIGFSAYSSRPTKASIVDNTALTASGFNVVAALDGNKYFSQTASYSSDVYETNYYWPSMSSHTMTFYAANTNIAGDNAGALTLGTGNATFTYAAPAASGNQKDIVVSTASVSNNIPTSTVNSKLGCVDLTFKHALTKVNFSFVGQDANTALTYEVKSITVNAVPNGTCTLAVGEDPAWSIVSGSTPATFSYEIPNDKNTVSGSTATKLESNLMLIPQTGDLDCTIEYTVAYNGTVVSDFTGSNGKSFTIPTAVDSKAWAPNASFRYILNLPSGGLVPITFTATVSDWGDENEENITVG